MFCVKSLVVRRGGVGLRIRDQGRLGESRRNYLIGFIYASMSSLLSDVGGL